jgi:hypothetical protein
MNYKKFLKHIKSKPNRTFMGFPLKSNIVNDELDFLIKICTDDFVSRPAKLYHGHCHGCTTQHLSNKLCSKCFCYENAIGLKPHWEYGPDMYLSSSKDPTNHSVELDILKDQFKLILLEEYPEYFI